MGDKSPKAKAKAIKQDEAVKAQKKVDAAKKGAAQGSNGASNVKPKP